MSNWKKQAIKEANREYKERLAEEKRARKEAKIWRKMERRFWWKTRVFAMRNSLKLFTLLSLVLFFHQEKNPQIYHQAAENFIYYLYDVTDGMMWTMWYEFWDWVRVIIFAIFILFAIIFGNIHDRVWHGPKPRAEDQRLTRERAEYFERMNTDPSFRNAPKDV